MGLDGDIVYTSPFPVTALLCVSCFFSLIAFRTSPYTPE